MKWGKREVTTKANGFTRRLDIADDEAQKAIEYKTGYTSRTEDIRWELQRDSWLVEDEWDITWVFEGSASQPLLDDLKAAGIKVKFVK